MMLKRCVVLALKKTESGASHKRVRMAWKVLISAPYFQPVVEQFRRVFQENQIEIVVPKVNERLSEKELLTLIDGIDGVIGGDDRFTERVLKRAKRLKVISKWGTGIDSIDEAAAKRLGIAVRNTPNAFTDPVSDSVLGYMLCFARQLPWMDRDVKSRRWSKKRAGVSLNETTLGVIGLGNVGKAVVRRASSFGMRIVGTDVIEIQSEFLDEYDVEILDKQTLLSTSDFVSLNCTLTPVSHHIIDAAALSMMKPTAYLVNTARGPLVDEDALASALECGIIAGAALDVFEVEPLPLSSKLRELDNCMLAPHNSNSSPEAWQRVHESTLENLLEVLGQHREEMA